VSSTGGQGDAFSDEPATAGDGTFIAFNSFALDLVSDKTTGFEEAYRRDRVTPVTVRVSLSSAGNQSNGDSARTAISANGLVTFDSDATNLVANDINNQVDVFRHDPQTGQTILVSVSTGGGQSDGFCGLSSISADGNLIAFESGATNLVPGGLPGVGDVLVRDVAAGVTSRVSVDSGNNPGNAISGAPRISADGRFVAFWSDATNLVAGDTNGVKDVFVHDRLTGQTTRVSIATDGAQGDGASGGTAVTDNTLDISDDGRFVVFQSEASNLVPGDTNGLSDIFRHDRQTGLTARLSVATGAVQSNGSSDTPKISGDGRFVVFVSRATNLDPRDQNGLADVFVHDAQTGETRALSLNLDVTNTGNGGSFFPDISADGRIIVFSSDASDLVVDDTNDARDVFSVANPFLP
jgi:Tol biopolymer transport system component